MLSSFYIGATGMKTHAQGMQVLGNNIANVNTYGYKDAQFRFADLLGESEIATGSLLEWSQAGQGVGLSTIMPDLSQGSFEPTNTTTDLGINGKGYFKISDPGSGDLYYTRAGGFRFNNEGYLVDPHGFRVQGLAGDIQLQFNANNEVVMDPLATSEVSMITNLGESNQSAGVSNANPFFFMSGQWDGSVSNAVPLSDDVYDFRTSLQIYDDQGDSHSLSVYYAKADAPNISNAGVKSHWEYVVGMNPGDDGRAAFAGTSGAGLLLRGTLTFDSSGRLESLSAFDYDGSGDVMNLSNWAPSALSANGYPEITASFTGGGAATFGLNMGLSNAGGWIGGAASAGAVGADASRLPGLNGTRQVQSTTNYGQSSSAIFADQDGYGQGVLQNVTVNKDGQVVGQFSNGQSDELGQLILSYFPSEYNLRREGDNYFSENLASGAAIDGLPNQGPLGLIVQSSLEQSNVDLAKEFVLMISTQRGFQANSKVITTSDQILQNAVNMKR